MCILILKPKGLPMPKKEYLKNSFENNPDGAGFSYSDGTKLILKKGLMTYSSFNNALKESGDLTNKTVMLHFRIATHGTVCAENTHPFKVLDGLVAGHNGILSIKNRGNLTDSETFFLDICAPILAKFSLYSKEFESVVEALIDSSKMVFLNSWGGYKTFGTFINEEGVFYSNATYQYSYKYPTYGKMIRNHYGSRFDEVYGEHGNSFEEDSTGDVNKFSYSLILDDYDFIDAYYDLRIFKDKGLSPVQIAKEITRLYGVSYPDAWTLLTDLEVYADLIEDNIGKEIQNDLEMALANSQKSKEKDVAIKSYGDSDEDFPEDLLEGDWFNRDFDPESIIDGEPIQDKAVNTEKRKKGKKRR